MTTAPARARPSPGRPTRAWLWALPLAACAAARSQHTGPRPIAPVAATAPPAPSAWVSTDAGAPPAPPGRFEIVADWDDLRRHSHGVYVGATRRGRSPDGQETLCASGLREVAESAAAAPAGELCTAVRDVVNLRGAIAAPVTVAPADAAWVLTEFRDGRERIAAVYPVAAPCTPTGCGALPRDALVRTYRCGQLDALYGRVPADDRACAADADCVALPTDRNSVLAANGSAAPAYRAALARWEPCVNPIACLQREFPYRARCRAGTCELERLP